MIIDTNQGMKNRHTDRASFKSHNVQV